MRSSIPGGRCHHRDHREPHRRRSRRRPAAALIAATTLAALVPFVDRIVEAMDLTPDLVICAGHALVDALALVTASHLDQQFLVVGAQLPEPTVNVTAAIWRGASSRGREVAIRPRPSTRTPYRRACRRGHPSRRRERAARHHRHRDLARLSGAAPHVERVINASWQIQVEDRARR
jgi:hypothetical protein